MSEDLNEILEIKSESQTPTEMQKETHGSDQKGNRKKYPILTAVSTIYKVLAWIVGICSCIALIYGLTLLEKNTPVGRPTGGDVILQALLYGIFGVIGCLAVSEGIKLFIDLESNSRKQIDLLTRLIEKK